MKYKLSWSEIGSSIFKGYLILVGVWVAFALTLDIAGIYIHFTNPELETRLAHEFSWKFDGTFKNDPNNIWYEGPKK